MRNNYILIHTYHIICMKAKSKFFTKLEQIKQEGILYGILPRHFNKLPKEINMTEEKIKFDRKKKNIIKKIMINEFNK